MTFTDWTPKGDTGNIGTTSDASTDGTTSLVHGHNANAETYVVWPDSETTAPTASEAVGDYKGDTGNNPRGCHVHRFQDVNNFVEVYFDPQNGSVGFRLWEAGSSELFGFTNLNMVQGEWNRMRSNVWTDANGHLRAKLEWDPDGNGFVELINNTPGRDALTSGGAVGFGQQEFYSTISRSFHDLCEVSY